MLRAIQLLCLGLVMVLPSCGDGAPPADAGRHVEEAGGFSYVPPSGWALRELPGFKYRIAQYESAGEFVGNVTVVDEAFDGSLEEYVEANRRTVGNMFLDLELGEAATFEFDSGAEGMTFSGVHATFGQRLHQTWYMLRGDGRFLVMTASRLAGADTALDEQFAATARTLRFE